MDIFTLIGLILGIIGLLLSIFFGIIGLGALWAVGALLARDAKKACVEFNSLLNWYVVANDGKRPYDANDANCISRMYSCHWGLLTSASEYMSEEMRREILAVTQKLILGQSIAEEYPRLAHQQPDQSPLLNWVRTLSISESIKSVMPNSHTGRLVRASIRLMGY
jgi:hypothetical protein